jgi:hypothetical protein
MYGLKSFVALLPCRIYTGETNFLFSFHLCQRQFFKKVWAGNAKANGREPKTGLGRVFNFKLGCFDNVRVLIYADAPPHL